MAYYDQSRLAGLFRSSRERKGLTQEQVAEAIGMTANGYSKIETGRNGVQLDLLWPLCGVLGIERVEVLDIVMPLFDGSVKDSALCLEMPAYCHMADDEFIPGHTVKPQVLLTQEELSFGMCLSEFLGRPLSDQSVFMLFMDIVHMHAQRMRREGRGFVPSFSDRSISVKEDV